MANIFQKLQTWLDKFLKSSVSEHPTKGNML